MKSTVKDWLKILVLLLDEAIVIVVVFFVIRALKIEIPLPIIIVAALLLGALVFITHKAILPTFHKKKVTGAEGLIGLSGTVIEPLTPVGVIQTGGEYWKAKAVGENVAVGEAVEIVALKGLTLMVKPKNQDLGRGLSSIPRGVWGIMKGLYGERMKISFKKERNLVIIGALVVIALAIGLPFLSKPEQDLLPKFALSQLAFGAVAFFIVFLALYFTIVQLRKSMAKPQLKVAFSADGKAGTEIIITKSKDLTQKPDLWVINTGNAITKLFQVDFDLPAIFNPRFTPSTEVGHGIPEVTSRNSPTKGNVIISFCSYEKIYCFVGNPAQIHSLHLKTSPQNYEKYPEQFKIKYRIFGDWAEKQEGELTVSCNKQ